jgi:hypothetical protein
MASLPVPLYVPSAQMIVSPELAALTAAWIVG